MKLKCLLVKLPDGRKFFTNKNNQRLLLEFANTFDAKLEIVEAYDPDILSLKDLAASICDHNKSGKLTAYQTKKKKITTELCDHFTEHKPTIRDYILTQFNGGKSVKIKDIAKKFSKHGLSVSTVYRHINHVKEMLEAESKTVIKVSPGVYKVSSSQ